VALPVGTGTQAGNGTALKANAGGCRRVTRIMITPSLLANILPCPGFVLEGALSRMKVIYLEGEIVPASLVTVFNNRLPTCKLVNVLGEDSEGPCHPAGALGPVSAGPARPLSDGARRPPLVTLRQVTAASPSQLGALALGHYHAASGHSGPGG
jgi:hypothetical protein